MKKTIIMVVILLICFTNFCITQSISETRLNNVEKRLEIQEHKLKDLKEEGGIAFIVLFLFGFILSIWAMNRQRSGLRWFLLGFIPMLNIIAASIALSIEYKQYKTGMRYHRYNSLPNNQSN
jgi:hypothetical protein